MVDREKGITRQSSVHYREYGQYVISVLGTCAPLWNIIQFLYFHAGRIGPEEITCFLKISVTSTLSWTTQDPSRIGFPKIFKKRQLRFNTIQTQGFLDLLRIAKENHIHFYQERIQVH
jgi:hypothetical protein